MAEFEIRDSLKSYFGSKTIKGAVDALSDGLKGDDQPEMTWDEARNYNQALLMAAQVRGDHNEMLFALWARTYGAALNLPNRKFDVAFESDYCTPDVMWKNGFVWQTMSRHGLDFDNSAETYELTIERKDRFIYLTVSKWNAEEDDYVDFAFDPTKVGSERRWTSFTDEGGAVTAKATPIELADFLIDPERHIPEMLRAAQDMVDYLGNII